MDEDTSFPWTPSLSWLTAITSLGWAGPSMILWAWSVVGVAYGFCRISLESSGMFHRSFDMSRG